MFVVKKKKGESDDALVNRFRKKTVASGILPELRERESFKKQSEKKKEKNYRHKFERKLAKKRNY